MGITWLNSANSDNIFDTGFSIDIVLNLETGPDIENGSFQ